MAIKSTYDEPVGTGGNREDLSDIIWDVSPTETPFISLCGKGKKATGTSHEWLTDKLNAPTTNRAVEGADAGDDNSTDRVRLSNNTQILTKTAIVSGTQENGVTKAGIKSEMAYQVGRRMKEIKYDLESACVGTFTGGSPLQIGKVAGSESVARALGGFITYCTSETITDVSTGGTPADPSGNGVDVPTLGSTRVDFAEAHLTDALAELWERAGTTENITALMGKVQRKRFSGFQSSATRYVTTDNKKLQASIDVYDGDFHTVTAMPDRYIDAGTVHLIDPAYVKLADMRTLKQQDLAKTGDSYKKQLIMETTLEVNNPLAHHTITGLTIS